MKIFTVHKFLFDPPQVYWAEVKETERFFAIVETSCSAAFGYRTRFLKDGMKYHFTEIDAKKAYQKKCEQDIIDLKRKLDESESDLISATNLPNGIAAQTAGGQVAEINTEDVLKEIRQLVQDSTMPIEVMTIRAAAGRVGRKPDDMKRTIERAKKQRFDVLRCKETGVPLGVILNDKWKSYETKTREKNNENI